MERKSFSPGSRSRKSPCRAGLPPHRPQGGHCSRRGLVEIPAALDQVAHAQCRCRARRDICRRRRNPVRSARLSTSTGHFSSMPSIEPLRTSPWQTETVPDSPSSVRPPAPAAAFDALHHEAALAGLRMHAEEHDGAAEQAVMRRPERGRGIAGAERRDDGVDHGRHDQAPARHRRRKARHHDVAFGDDHLQRAERAFVDRLERRRSAPCRRRARPQRARIDRGLALARAARQVDRHAAAGRS